MSIFIKFHKFLIILRIFFKNYFSSLYLEKNSRMQRWFLSLKFLVKNTNMKYGLKMFLQIFFLR